MTEYEQPFDPQQVEKQVDRLSASGQERYSRASPDQRFLHDLRLILASEDGQDRSAEDERSLRRAWVRIGSAGLSQHTTQRIDSPATYRRFTDMTTLPSAPERPALRRNRFKRRLATLSAAVVALLLAGALVLFTLASRGQPRTNTLIGTAVTPGSTQTLTQTAQEANYYAYNQQGEPVYGLQWFPDSTRIISTNEDAYSWDAFSGAHSLEYGSTQARTSTLVFARLSPDGKTLAVWNVGQIDLYDAATGRHLSTLTYPFAQTPQDKAGAPHFEPYIGWSPDGEVLRALVQLPGSQGQVTNILVTYSVATGARQDLRLDLNDQLDQVAWSPNGKYVAVGRPGSGAVSVIVIATGWVVGTEIGGGPIETISLAWSPDSSRLAADFVGNGTLRIWDALTAEGLEVYQRAGTQPAWSPNGKYLASINGRTITILNADTGAVLHTITSDGSAVYSLAWSPDGTAFAAGGASADGNSGLVQVWRVRL